MDDLIFTPYRVLEEVVESTVTLITDDRNASWQPIYISVLLTAFQCLVFITIFECGRRIKYVETVFDRRRTRYPTRTPAPLMRQKGCCRGWLAFEWWRVRITDPAYQQDSWDEHRLLQMEAIGNMKTEKEMMGVMEDLVVKEAEEIVYRQSPHVVDAINNKATEMEAMDVYGYGDEQPEPPTPNYNYDDPIEVYSSSSEDENSSSSASNSSNNNNSSSKIGDSTSHLSCADEEAQSRDLFNENGADAGAKQAGTKQMTKEEEKQLKSEILEKIARVEEQLNAARNAANSRLDTRTSSPRLTFFTGEVTPTVSTQNTSTQSLYLDDVSSAPQDLPPLAAFSLYTVKFKPSSSEVDTSYTSTVVSNGQNTIEESKNESLLPTTQTPASAFSLDNVLGNISIAPTSSAGCGTCHDQLHDKFDQKSNMFSDKLTMNDPSTYSLKSTPIFVPMKQCDDDDDFNPRMRSTKPNRIDRHCSYESDPGARRLQRSMSLDQTSTRVSLSVGGIQEAKVPLRRHTSIKGATDSRARYPRGFSLSNGDMSSGVGRLSATGASVTNYVKNRVLMISEHNEEDDDDDTESGQNFIATKVSRRRLDPEDKELLRCIGLDSFMTLRFIKFCSDVSIYPLVLSLFTIIPMYMTADNGIVGFFSTTVVALDGDDNWRYWLAMVYGMLHFGYILRRLWIEWEVFLPLRYDFLENGDFEKEKYKEQFRKTCLIEYIPKAQKHDRTLFEFFDSISPGEVRRAEVLLNTEHLRSLIKQRMNHIVAYEDVYAKKVHAQAMYLRELKAYQRGDKKSRCFRKKHKPREPTEPMIRVWREMPSSGTDYNATTPKKKEFRKVEALRWHYEHVQSLNREIDDEYMRLAQAQRRPVTHNPETFLTKWLGLKYLTGSDTGRLHSSTAFVEFRTFAAKQHAIQCNITGMHNYLVVTPVPEVRDLLWDNMHVSRALTDTRKAWANLLLTGGLFFWSTIVFTIRSVDNLSSLAGPIAVNSAVAVFLDYYAPALIVEGLVRAIPKLLIGVCMWIRFKAHSETDHYILNWYFGYRLITFLFLLIGGQTLLDSSSSIIQNPLEFFKSLSKNVILNSQFFISYVIVSGGVQVFFRFSQWHNLALYWMIKQISKEESQSQRRLEKLEKDIKKFHLDEFIPLFLFIFMVGALYGMMAPLSNFFVFGFFGITYKVFRFMTLFVYGNHYEGGGFLFYTISDILFYVIYMIQLVLTGFLSVNGTSIQAGVFVMMIFVTYFVHCDVHRTFVVPSKTLSLTKARAFDESQDPNTLRDRKFDKLKRAKKEYEEACQNAAGEDNRNPLFKRLLPRTSSGDFSVDSKEQVIGGSTFKRNSMNMGDYESLEDAVKAFNQRYNGDDEAFNDDSDDGDQNVTSKGHAFFIYRQPALNRATWEVAPKPYRESLERDESADIWGDDRPEETRKVARQRRASIAQYYGG